MATYNASFRTAAQLTAETRAAADLVEASDALTEFLPSFETATLEYTLDGDTLGLPRAASFRSYDATAPYGREQSVGSRKGSLPASSIKLPLGELQQLLLQQASATAISEAQDRKARVNGQSIAVRAILARGQAIETGKVTLNENKIVTEIDFGRKASHTVIAAALWSLPDTPILTQILALQATYKATNGTRAQGAIFSSDVLASMATNDEFIAAATGSGTSGLTRISEDLVYAVLRQNGFIDPLVYDVALEDVSGTLRPVISDDVFILTPARDGFTIDGGPLGATQWGIPAEALQSAYGIPAGERAGIFGCAFSHPDPEGMDILASAIFLPLLASPNKTLTATVL
jgi:hypothetical protein